MPGRRPCSDSGVAIAACCARSRWRSCCAGARSAACCQAPTPRRRRRTAPPAPRQPPRALAAQRQLPHHRQARSGEPHAHRRASCSPGATSSTTAATHAAASTSTTTPGATPRSTWMRERMLAGDTRRRPRGRRRLGLDRRHQPARDRAGGAPADVTAAAALHRARRRQRRRPDGGGGAARRAGRARARRSTSQIAWTSRVPRTFARTGVDRRLLLPRAVVPEDRRARGRRLELPPVPRRHRVLRRLRRLRRAADRADAAGSSARPASSASRRDEGDGTTTHHYYAGGRPRLRLDDEPATIVERTRALRASDAAAGRDAAAAAARARRRRPSATSPRRAPRSYYGEWFGALSLRPHHDRRSGLAERRRRHGVSDAVHRRHAWLAPRARRRSPKSVTVHEAGHQFWYGIVATNEFEHAWMDEGLNTFSTARVLEQVFEPQLLREALLRRLHPVGLRATCR